MKRTILFLALLVTFLPLVAGGKGKKEQQETIRKMAEVLQRGEAVMNNSIPGFLLSNEAATKYCRNVLSQTDEQYSSDTAQANAIIREVEWIDKHKVALDETVVEKFKKKMKRNPEMLFSIYSWTGSFLWESQQRYDIMRSHCEKQLELRREARQRTMPQGQLVSLYYKEDGPHIPVNESYELRRDPASNSWKLNGKEVPEEVAQEVRRLAEQYKVYQCMSQYLNVPSKLSGPREMGGAPAYTFRLQFEGGTISSMSDDQRPPESCWKILNYLKNILMGN